MMAVQWLHSPPMACTVVAIALAKFGCAGLPLSLAFLKDESNCLHIYHYLSSV